jgi:hypothetical protein
MTRVTNINWISRGIKNDTKRQSLLLHQINEAVQIYHITFNTEIVPENLDM